jgi:hypothetical protein
MPLDAGTRARSQSFGAPAINAGLCQKKLAAFADRADGDVVVACAGGAPVR